MTHEEAQQLIARHFEGTPLDAESWRRLRDHLRECDMCRAIYDERVEAETALADGDPVSPLRMNRMMAMGTPAPASALDASLVSDSGAATSDGEKVIRFPARIWGPVLAVAAAAAVVMIVPNPVRSEFQERGGGCDHSKRQAWVSVYSKGADGQPAKLAERLYANRPLMFAYTNLTSSPYRYLAIAGLDATGRAHWYHPAYVDVNASPKSIAISPGQADKELPEEVLAEHAPGKLEICALFSKEPLSIAQVDAALEKTKTWPKTAHRVCQTVEVTP